MYFLYILKELQKKYNIILELEIIKLIYNYINNIIQYEKYEKYNLFELMYMLKKSGFTCIMNKKTIIDIFIINKLYINHNFDNINIENKEYKCTDSEIISRFTLGDYEVSNRDSRTSITSCTYNKKLYCFIINDKNRTEIMQIHNKDIISFDNNTYIINMYSKIYQNYINKYRIINFVKLKNLQTNIETIITTQEFINLFIKSNITYKKSFYFLI